MQTSKKKFFYLYCVTKTKPSHRNFKEAEVKVYPIYFQGTYAIVSKVSPAEFSEENLKKRLADMEWVEKKVFQHEKVIEDIMQEATVLPFKFPTVFQAEENVEGLLKKDGEEFKKIIAGLEGREEWGLKIYSDLRRFKDIVEKEDERLKEKEQEIASASKGKAYFLKKKKGKFIEDIINERISEYTKDSFERLKRASMEAKINKILPREVTQRKDEMVFNVAFLINKKKVDEFKNIVEYLKEAYSDKGLSFDCTGPWPPYNFCGLSREKV